MKRALILHGWGANPGMHWFPSEIGYLRSLGYEVQAPTMPNKYNPHENDWLKVIENFAPDEESVLIGHSLGGTTILEYLEKSGQKVDKVVLVVTPIRFNDKLELGKSHSFKLYTEKVTTDCFLGLCRYEEIFDWGKIQSAANKFIIIYKKNDIRVPSEEGQFLAEKLGSGLTLVDGTDHGHMIDLDLINKHL